MSGEGRESRCAGNRTGNMVRLGAFPRVCVNSERLLKRCRALSLDPPSPRQSCCSHADAAHRSTWCQALIGQELQSEEEKKREERSSTFARRVRLSVTVFHQLLQRRQCFSGITGTVSALSSSAAPGGLSNDRLVLAEWGRAGQHAARPEQSSTARIALYKATIKKIVWQLL